MSGKLQGRIALVTGGNSGIGLATAKEFLKEGAFVYVTARRQAELDQAIATLGANSRSIRTDVSKLSELDALFKQIEVEKGRIDILFVNAGVASFSPLGSITEEHFDQHFGTNVKGLLFTVQKALPLMPDGGAILLNASIESKQGKPAFSVYSATKAAVRSFARGWTNDLKDRGIRVNVISPGPIETPGLNGLAGATDAEQLKGFHDHLGSGVPLGRIGRAEEVARVAVFLVSTDASFVAGIELFVDGGVAQV
ncbi:SDR family oxidoreductase [Acidipila sp. EB88]|uniref:SDR family oxidoreductase n=1 Tax=Acidipila sp. EB88 TaxID=2305226 RepID=UPI000F600A3C|nr:SDR family oxidoreductase [Acidipila sp. EB88]RRA50324.1 SDR family oxidoreductase [Acidipila sp. EB88]